MTARSSFTVLPGPELDGTIWVAGKPVRIVRTGNGAIDTTFNSPLGLITSHNGHYDNYRGAFVQPDNKIVVAGWATGTTPLVNGSSILLRRYLADGSLDTGFGTGGTVLYQSPGSPPWAPYDFTWSTLLLPDNKIMVSASSRYDSTSFKKNESLLLRYNSDGSLDTTFNGSGMSRFRIAGESVTARGFARQPADGKLLFSGEKTNSGVPDELLVFRYLDNGNLDTGFGTGGSVILPGGTGAGLALQDDGKIVVAKTSSTWTDFSLIRLNPDGTADTTFGTNGETTPISHAIIWNGQLNGNEIAIQPDGKILTYYYDAGTGSTYDLKLVRYTSSGQLDTTFGTAGVLTLVTGYTDAGGNTVTATFVVEPGGRITVSARAASPTGLHDIALFRLQPDGTADSSFGYNGELRYNSRLNGPDINNKLILSGNSIYLAGNTFAGTNRWTDAMLMKLQLVPDTTPPVDGAPFTATAGNGQVELTWTAATDTAGVTGYKLVTLTTATPADCSGTALYSGTALTFTDTGLTNGVPSYYRLCATDAAGNWSTGVTTSATPRGTYLL